MSDKDEKYLKKLEHSRQWKARNKEKVSAYSAIWRAANKEYAKIKKKEWDLINPEKKQEHMKAFKTKQPDYHKNKHLEANYGITLDEYDRMLHNQNGRCAVCSKVAEDTYRKRLFVDHCHETGRIRGLLCQQCNTALGMVKDDKDILFALVSYLDIHSNERIAMAQMANNSAGKSAEADYMRTAMKVQ